ncbi:GntR family transcriptional regulator [Chelatococcus sp. SYSU_G07232]|uniref:GntR family transcriptional regulator n=1 Tax=Chelatococcus albus TaxID=3047466 RepID=A0ABT7AKL3_9HYPH|nr:GntR family transcriptional regulator [Chelatococcus sp. SYSU_G07232]MDJ1159146.1 GntR family transcriptional regulator [Chelatococcus sp. SYSU_G07232]
MSTSDPGAHEWRSPIRLVDEVVKVLRERIYSGALRPGEVLRQEQIAADFGISRTPLREAFRVLERDGLIRNEPRRGVRVASADLRRLKDAYDVREAIDGVAARLAAGRRDAAALDRLAAVIEAQRAALEPWDPIAYTRTNVEFHVGIMEAAHNEFLTPQVPLVRMTAQVFTPALALSVERAVRAVAEHEEILAAMRAGDAARAEELARAHIRRTRLSLDARISAADGDGGAEGKAAP